MKKILTILSLSFTFTTAAFSDDNAIPQYARSAIETLAAQEIMKGNDDGSFAPDRPINRAEFCKIVSLATQIEIKIPNIANFPDVPKNTWFFPYVESLKTAGWIDGYPDGTFRPGDPINRAEIAKILSQAFGLESITMNTDQNWFDKYIRVLNKNHLLPHGASMSTLEPDKYPSRAEIAQQLARFINHSNSSSPLPEGTFLQNTSGNFEGEIYVRGYLKTEPIPEPFCTENCTEYTGVKLVVAESGSPTFQTFLEKNKGNASVDNTGVLIGCLEGDKSIRYINDSDQFRMKEYKIDAQEMFTASIENPKVFRLNKHKLSWGMGTPACYSHFTEIELEPKNPTP